MSREIRRVVPGWEHPSEERPTGKRHIPLHDGKDNAYSFEVAAWKVGYEQWEAGTHEEFEDAQKDGRLEWWDWSGPPPVESDYMPAWTPEQATHYQVYETVTEGTPVSPVFATEEECRRWIDDNLAPWAAAMLKDGGWCPSALAFAKS